VVLTASGAVFTFGNGGTGQLGHETLDGCDRLLSPVRVEALAGRRVVRIAAGATHTAVLTQNGVVLTFGYNDYRQLGRAAGYTLSSSLPGEVELAALAGERAVGLTASGRRTGVVTSNGRVVTFGEGLQEGGTVQEQPE
jgi:alpha-tubulin suppressor-like RCC1 family protein